MKVSAAFSKLERRLHGTCKTSRLAIAAKFQMHLLGSLINSNSISEVLMHGRFFEKVINLLKISLVAYKNLLKNSSSPNQGPEKNTVAGCRLRWQFLSNYVGRR